MPRAVSPLVCVALAVALALEASVPTHAETVPPATPREKGDRAIHARAILREYCHECHGGKATKGTVAVMNQARLVATGPNPVPFVAPRDAARSQIIQFIEDGSMPPGGRKRPTDDEVAVLKAWIADSATSFPASFDADTTLKLLLDDHARHPEDAPHVRYLSFAHLVDDNAIQPNRLAVAERDLFDALKRCGLTEMPVPVDGPATLYRLDTRQAGWDSRALFVQEAKDPKSVEGLHPLSPYDLVLLEYPLAIGLPKVHSLTIPLDDYLTKAKLTRPIPLVHADWLTGMLKTDSPLAADLLRLSELHTALKKDGFPAAGMEARMPCGPQPRAFGRLNPVPAAQTKHPDAVLPLGSWYAGDCQPLQPPFTIAADVIETKSGKIVTSVEKEQSFKLRVTTDRQAHFLLLLVWSNGQVALQPTQRNRFLSAGEHRLGPDGKDDFAIGSILTGEKEATEYFILLASPDELPAPVIVRSRHSRAPACEKQMPRRYPVYRFLFNVDARFDPSKVVRKVIPVTVTAKGN